MKIFKNKKIRNLLITATSLTSAIAIATPIAVLETKSTQHNYSIDLRSFADSFMSNITSLEQLNFLLDRSNSNEVIDQLNQSDLIPPEYNIIDVFFRLSNNENQINGQNVMIDYDIIYSNTNNNSSAITETFTNVPVGISIIDFSIDEFRNTIKTMDTNLFNNVFAIENIKQTIFDMNVGLYELNTESISVFDAYENDPEYIQKMNMNIDVLLKSGFAYNLAQNTSSTTPTFTNAISIHKIKTEFSNYKVSKENLVNSINSIQNVDNVNNLLSKEAESTNVLLDTFVSDSNLVNYNGLIKDNSIRISGLDQDGYIKLEITTNLLSGETIVTEASTGIQALKLDESIFKSNFKLNVNNDSDIENVQSTIYNTNSLNLANSSNESSGNLAPMSAISETSAIDFSDLVRVDINWLRNFDCEINLVDGYCFYNSESNAITNSYTLLDVLSNIIVNTNLEETLIDELKANLLNMTIDNFTTYFEGATKYPEEYNEGRMTLSKIKELSNNKISDEICESWSFNRSTDDTNTDPLLKLNLTLNFKAPYTYQGESTYVFKNIQTNTYDPNSDYNLRMFEWYSDNPTHIRRVEFALYSQSVNYSQSRVFIPFKTESINLYQNGKNGALEPGQNGWPTSYRIDTFDATFAKNLVYLQGHRGFFKAVINHVDFSGLPNFIGSLYGGYTSHDAEYFFADSKIWTVDFKNCPKLSNIGTNGWFKRMYNLDWVSFRNCPSLKFIPGETFKEWSSSNHAHPTLYLNGTTEITGAVQFSSFQYSDNMKIYVSSSRSWDTIRPHFASANNVLVWSD